MRDSFREAVVEAFMYVFEKLAFMFSDEADNGEPIEAPLDCVCARAGFTGIRSGCITLIAPRDLCIDIAASSLGTDATETSGEETALDALKEITNIICAHILTGLAGTGEEFHMSIPEGEAVGKDYWKHMDETPGTMRFTVDERTILLNVLVKP